MSLDGTKYYICYTKDDKNGDCLIFDLSTNEWSEPINYLSNCLLKLSSLNIKLFDSLIIFLYLAFNQKQCSKLLNSIIILK